MDWFNSFTITLGSTGLIFWGLSYYLIRNPPKQINLLYGYRTKASMASQERWDYAQQFSSNVLIRTGKLLMLAAMIRMLLPPWSEVIEVIVAVFVVIGSCIHLMITTENELKLRFG